MRLVNLRHNRWDKAGGDWRFRGSVEQGRLGVFPFSIFFLDLFAQVPLAVRRLAAVAGHRRPHRLAAFLRCPMAGTAAAVGGGFQGEWRSSSLMYIANDSAGRYHPTQEECLCRVSVVILCGPH